MTYVLFDIGVSRTQVAVSKDLEKIDKVSVFKTPALYKNGIKTILESVTNIAPKTKITAVAGGIRGLLAEDKSRIENDSFLQDWAKKPLVDDLNKHFKCPVYLENDTALAGLGEASCGAGEGMDIVVYHTIGSGVGGVKIEEGRIDSASLGFEPGHQVLDIDRTILGDEIKPTLENLVSGAGLEARLGVKPTDIPQEDMIWNELAEYLAQGLKNTILYWSPEVIVLGGAMITGKPKIPIEAIRKYTVEALDGLEPCPFITISTLDDKAGLYGAMVYLKQVE